MLPKTGKQRWGGPKSIGPQYAKIGQSKIPIAPIILSIKIAFLRLYHVISNFWTPNVFMFVPEG